MTDSPICVAGIGAFAGRKSMLPEILARWTAMEVREAASGDALVAKQVLVIPPGVVATVRDGRLSLRQLPPDAAREVAPTDTLAVLISAKTWVVCLRAP